ncbi:MAG: DNA polymerase III subunit gamma/tau [Nitrospirota bacterium]|nr:DNA polymerase III subunit gamma/tau [Nitrospirota bacterium]
MSYLVLARKWRPQGFDDLIGQEPIMNILKNAISQSRISHAYIFSGPRGVGKTTTARILAKALNCKTGPAPSPCGACESCVGITDGSSVDVTEIDGASNNSVDDIRDLRERVKYAPSGGKYKVYIIDEVHMLSTSAFNALLKTLEEPPSHVIFVLATTEMKKIPATVLSRCQHMPFRRISASMIKTRLVQISDAEGIRISSPALSLVAKAADGSVRDSLTILDQLSSFSSEITEENVQSLLGMADFGILSGVSRALIEGNRVALIDAVNLLSEKGTDFRSFTKELVQFFRDLLVASVVQKPEDALDLSSDEIAVVKDIISASSEDQLTLMLSELMKAEADVRNSSSPRLALEMALIKASFLSSMKPLKEVIENIDYFSRQVRGSADEGISVNTPPVKTAPVAQKESPETERTATAEPEMSYASDEPVNEIMLEKPKGPLSENSSYEEESIESADEPSGAPAASAGADIASAWAKTLEKIDAPLASKISQATVELKESELLLTLNGGNAVFEDAIKKNLKSLEGIVSGEYGNKLRIKLATSQKKSPRRKDLKEKVLNEPLVKEALELFEGRIVDVAQFDNTKNGGDHV